MRVVGSVKRKRQARDRAVRPVPTTGRSHEPEETSPDPRAQAGRTAVQVQEEVCATRGPKGSPDAAKARASKRNGSPAKPNAERSRTNARRPCPAVAPRFSDARAVGETAGDAKRKVEDTSPKGAVLGAKAERCHAQAGARQTIATTWQPKDRQGCARATPSHTDDVAQRRRQRKRRRRRGFSQSSWLTT